MLIARVIGDLVATQKHSSHEGMKILMVQPLNLDGTDRGDAVVAFDAVDAGVGDRGAAHSRIVVGEGYRCRGDGASRGVDGQPRDSSERRLRVQGSETGQQSETGHGPNRGWHHHTYNALPSPMPVPGGDSHAHRRVRWMRANIDQ